MTTTTQTAQVVEYLAALSRCESEAEMLDSAAELAAWTLDTEVSLLLRGTEVLSSTGWPRGASVAPVLRALRSSSTAALEVPGLGWLAVLAAPVGPLGTDGRLVVARLADDFEAEERALVLGMGRLLGLALVAARALDRERELRVEVEATASQRLELLAALRARELLLTTLLDVQRAISHRRPLEEVLDLVTQGTSASLGGAPVALVLESGVCADRLAVVSATYPGAVVSSEALTQLAERATTCGSVAAVVDDGVRVAAPVHIQGRAVGALLARVALPAQQEAAALLATFAEHASLALGDADSVETMRQSFYDQLTRLPNRAMLLDRLDRVLAAPSARTTELALLFVDLDRFKEVNDRHGHAVGDLVLQECASRLQACLRTEDTPARLGGDEFAVLLEDITGAHDAVAVATRVAVALSQPFWHAGRELAIGASVGVAVAAVGRCDRADLLRDADLAMYAAKGDPTTSVVLFEEGMHAARAQQLELEADLQHAVERGELVLHYQPVVDLEDGHPLGVEALVRWDHPVRGLVRPDAFVPVAEQTGAITAIGRWVLEEACRAASRLRRWTPHLTVSVNVSARQFTDPLFVDHVRAALTASRLDPRALVLEITESTLLPGDQAVLDRLEELARLHVSLSVDDFGTGYSSLSYLRRLPVDELKIDRSFVESLGYGEGAALVRTIVDLARALGLRCVAEGVEEPAQASLLAALGCDRAQGYLFSRPVPEVDLDLDALVRVRCVGAA